MTVRLAALALAAGIAFGACRGSREEQGGTRPEAVPERPAPAESTPPPAEPGTADTTVADTAWTAGILDRPGAPRGAATLVGVRGARHEDFDRIVFEFAEPEPPGLHVEYVDRPVRDCGAGQVVPIAGDGWLAVRFYPANAHSEEGGPTAGPREIELGLPIVLEIERTCDFEAVVEYVLGVASPNRYRVLDLVNPTRIVVDVRHGR